MALRGPLFVPRVKFILTLATGLFAVAYAVDYLSLRIQMRHPKTANPLETVTAPRILVLAEKDGRYS